MKKFKVKFKDLDGTVKAEIVHAVNIDDARAMGQALCKIRKVSFLAISTVVA